MKIKVNDIEFEFDEKGFSKLGYSTQELVNAFEKLADSMTKADQELLVLKPSVEEMKLKDVKKPKPFYQQLRGRWEN